MTQSAFIDLHSHTTESDGTLSPEELVALAVRSGLRALAITDHDTFTGYRKAAPFAQTAGLELIQGIEVSSRLSLAEERVRWPHVLVYFISGQVGAPFANWLQTQREDRRDRNRKLAAALQGRGIEVTFEEVEARGRSLAGRPHFARILVEKGYALDADDAFRRFIGEDAPSFVERQSRSVEEVLGLVRDSGGISVIAHPIRLGLPHDDRERQILARLKEAGLAGLEVYHSEQGPELQKYYLATADELGLLPTGGSDFHGAVKPDIELGSGRDGNVHVPYEVLKRMKEFHPEKGTA